MRYAIISDVHANEAALRAVLTDAADAHAERIVCLGDVLGYGPDPVSTLELVYRRAHVCLAGNHDDAVSNRFPVDDFSTFAAAAVARHRAALSQEAIDWLRHLPHVCEFGGGGPDPSVGAFACAHGEFSDPKNFGYVLEAEDALPSWKERSEQLLFVGHSHKPGIFVLGESGVPHALEPADFMLEPGKRYLVNVGSVGYPRTGVCRSFYCIYDDCSRTVFFRSLPFDLESYSEKMHGKGLDEAPWMRAREKERQGHEVRRATNFAKAEPQQSSVGTRKRILLKPIREEAPRDVAATSQQPKPLVLTGGEKSDPRSTWRAAAIVVAVAVVVLFIVVWGVSSLRRARYGDERATAVAAPANQPVDVKAAAPAVQQQGAGEAKSRFTGEKVLADGWRATFERADDQSAEPLGSPPLFRVKSAKRGTVCLAKNIQFVERPQNVYCSVKLVTAGKDLPFEFMVRVVFHGKDGAEITRKTIGTWKKGTEKARAEQVPPGAVRATMEVDCSCEGVFDIAVPYFSVNPEPERAKAPAPPKPAPPKSAPKKKTVGRSRRTRK